jgi:hypothetical protein
VAGGLIVKMTAPTDCVRGDSSGTHTRTYVRTYATNVLLAPFHLAELSQSPRRIK